MATGKVKVLILEDDVTLSGAMKQAFEKKGCEVFLATRTEEAQTIIRNEAIRYCFVDCLLPSGSGVDFIQGIRGQYSQDLLNVILMSGILSDPSFIKDSTRSTQAIAFLKKPFDLDQAFGLIKEAVSSGSEEDVPPRKFLYQLLSKESVTLREKRRAIESLDEIYGFDLPYIYSLMVETNSSGHLNIINPKGDVLGISFSQGKIVGVDSPDKETFLGKLLIESGYILPADLEQTLSTASSKKIGERLIQANLLSPHAFEIVLSNQMKLRLSRTIQENSVKLTIVFTDVELTRPNIDSEDISILLHDWMASKFTLRWLKEHYNQFLSQRLDMGPHFSESNYVLNMPLLSSLKDLVPYLISGKVLRDLLETTQYEEERLYKALHFLLVKGILIFKADAVNVVSMEERTRIIKRLYTQFSTKSKFEQFDMLIRMTGGSENDPKYVYKSFMNIIGNADVQPSVADMYKKLVAIAEAFKQAGDLGQIGRIKEELQKSEVETKLKATKFFDDAKALLLKSQYQAALDTLKKAVAADPTLDKNRLYFAWVKIGLSDNGAKSHWLTEAEMDLMQATPEEKFDAIYSFVSGLMCKAKDDMFGAKKAFEKAIAMDSSMIVARRELTLMQLQATKGKEVSLANKDLKDIVSGFFRKK